MSEGKVFESSVETSCKSQHIFHLRIRDVYIPPKYRKEIRVPKNRYDCILFHNGYLLPVEFKSGKGKSFSFSESIIKEHQIKSLQEANQYEKTIPGFIFNFREVNNQTFFIHINDFIKYKGIAQSEFAIHNFKSKINKSSIPLDICREVGIEIKSELKRTNYRYDVQGFIDEAVERFG